jgi:hypothetical protein
LPRRQELPHQRRDDRKVLCLAYQEHDQRGGSECAEGGERRPKRAAERPVSERRSERKAPENPPKVSAALTASDERLSRPFGTARQRERFLDGLRKAGLPEV